MEITNEAFSLEMRGSSFRQFDQLKCHCNTDKSEHGTGLHITDAVWLGGVPNNFVISDTKYPVS